MGGFHRAHQAVYTDDVLNNGRGDWAIIGASLRSPTADQQLTPQDGLYTVCEAGPEGTTHRVVGALKQVITANKQAGFDQLLSSEGGEWGLFGHGMCTSKVVKGVHTHLDSGMAEKQSISLLMTSERTRGLLVGTGTKRRLFHFDTKGTAVCSC